MKNISSRKLFVLGRSVLLSYICTAVMLLIISLLVYKAGIGSVTISVLIVVTYIVSGFLGGLLAGKRVPDRQYLWGLASSVVYLVIYFLVLLIAGFDEIISVSQYIRTVLLILFSGTLGGMLA